MILLIDNFVEGIGISAKIIKFPWKKNIVYDTRNNYVTILPTILKLWNKKKNDISSHNYLIFSTLSSRKYSNLKNKYWEYIPLCTTSFSSFKPAVIFYNKYEYSREKQKGTWTKRLDSKIIQNNWPLYWRRIFIRATCICNKTYNRNAVLQLTGVVEAAKIWLVDKYFSTEGKGVVHCDDSVRNILRKVEWL